MRREVLAAVVLMLLASWPAGASPGPSQQTFLPHGPISIVSDANFTAENGVVSGTGTPADPYVIAGWHIHGGIGSAIFVHNTTASFVIRDNVLEGAAGLSIYGVAGQPLVSNNKFVVTVTGLSVRDADATIRDNSFIGASSFRHTGRAIVAANSDAVIHGNSISLTTRGIDTTRGSPMVTDNDLHHVGTFGIRLHMAVGSHVTGNIVTHADGNAIEVAESQHVLVANNTVSTTAKGLVLWLDKDIDVRDNTVRFTMQFGVLFEASSGNFTGNLVQDGMADGVQIWASTLVMLGNTVENHLGIGLHFSMSESLVEANVVSSNGIGVALRQYSLPHLRANVLVNNSIALDVPYDSRQAILHMEGNLVNGLNVDGRLDASQQALFYHEANVTIQGGVHDGGFAAGYRGAIAAQGQIVLYDVDTATIDGAVVSHGQVGVGVVNSFNVVVANALLATNAIGFRAETKDGKTPVPPCAVAVKDTKVALPIDPPATVGIQIDDCFAIVTRVNVSLVDIGIKFNARARGEITNSTVTSTKIGLDVAGQKGEVEVRGNLVYDNRVGARFAGTHGVVDENVFLNNSDVGVRLDNGASIRFRWNNLTGNGAGLVDARACTGWLSCSSVAAEGNAFWRNGGDGAVVHGKSSWRDDTFRENRGSGLRLSSDATIRNVTSSDNDEDGLYASGEFVVRDSEFERNGGNGAYLVGTGQLRNSVFRHNEYSGIRLRANYVEALRLNVSFNFDGILFEEVAPPPRASPVPSVGLPEILRLLPSTQVYGPDPLDVHLTAFIGNTRDAIRAGTAVVNATHNYWGTITGPAISFADQVGAYRNGVSPYVRFTPYFSDPEMTQTGPVFLL